MTDLHMKCKTGLKWVKIYISQMYHETFWKIFPKGSHYVKNFRIQSFSGPHFPVFGLNTEIYEVNLRIQYSRGKIRTRKTPNTDTFYTVSLLHISDQYLQRRIQNLIKHLR